MRQMADFIRQTTVEELEGWELHGALWRTVALGTEHVVVELCTCYGEPVDMVTSRDPRVIEFVRQHAQQRDS